MTNHSQGERKRCAPDGLSYLSNPPQNRCKDCGQFWFSKDESPVCRHYTPVREEHDEGGSRIEWQYHQEYCPVWLCNPRRNHQNGQCTCGCTCGLESFIRENRAALLERLEQEVGKLDKFIGNTVYLSDVRKVITHFKKEI